MCAQILAQRDSNVYAVAGTCCQWSIGAHTHIRVGARLRDELGRAHCGARRVLRFRRRNSRHTVRHLLCLRRFISFNSHRRLRYHYRLLLADTLRGCDPVASTSDIGGSDGGGRTCDSSSTMHEAYATVVVEGHRRRPRSVVCVQDSYVNSVGLRNISYCRHIVCNVQTRCYRRGRRCSWSETCASMRGSTPMCSRSF